MRSANDRCSLSSSSSSSSGGSDVGHSSHRQNTSSSSMLSSISSFNSNCYPRDSAASVRVVSHPARGYASSLPVLSNDNDIRAATKHHNGIDHDGNAFVDDFGDNYSKDNNAAEYYDGDDYFDSAAAAALSNRGRAFGDLCTAGDYLAADHGHSSGV